MFFNNQSLENKDSFIARLLYVYKTYKSNEGIIVNLRSNFYLETKSSKSPAGWP